MVRLRLKEVIEDGSAKTFVYEILDENPKTGLIGKIMKLINLRINK